MKRDFILTVFGIFLAGIMGFIQYVVNPINWGSILALFNTVSLWIAVVIIIGLIGVIWIVIRLAFMEIKKIDDKKDSKEFERHNEILLAIKDLAEAIKNSRTSGLP